MPDKIKSLRKILITTILVSCLSFLYACVAVNTQIAPNNIIINSIYIKKINGIPKAQQLTVRKGVINALKWYYDIDNNPNSANFSLDISVYKQDDNTKFFWSVTNNLNKTIFENVTTVKNSMSLLNLQQMAFEASADLFNKINSPDYASKLGIVAIGKVVGPYSSKIIKIFIKNKKNQLIITTNSINAKYKINIRTKIISLRHNRQKVTIMWSINENKKKNPIFQMKQENILTKTDWQKNYPRYLSIIAKLAKQKIEKILAQQ